MQSPTVANLIEALQKLPQDAIVQVKEEIIKGWGITTEFRDLDLSMIDLCDYTIPPHNDPIRYPLIAGKKIVCLYSE
jgi:hypothetical protein